VVLHHQLVNEGGYQSAESERLDNAAWEKRWFAEETNPSSFSVSGGNLHLKVDTATRAVTGHWKLRQVIAPNQVLNATLPHGLEVTKAIVDTNEVTPQSQFDHIAIPLGDCAARGCEVAIDWSVRSAGWSAPGDATWSSPAGFWFRAEDVAPRLGFDADRILRGAATRQSYGLNRDMRLPDASSAVSSSAIAPASMWQWQVELIKDNQQTEIRGNPFGTTNAPLDFAALWGAKVKLSQSDGVRIAHARQNANQVDGVAQDASDMRACVTRRLGTPIEIDQVAQWPRGLGTTHFSGTTLQLAEEPHWDIADRGVGRWLRRADIARALARRQLVDMADLRNTSGSLWISEGAAGAIGLLCVADTDGLDALAKILVRHSEAATNALALSEVPVGPLADALSDSWVTDYAPLAALNWVAQQSPSALKELMAELKKQQELRRILIDHAGQPDADNMLGKPLASSLKLVSDGSLIHVDGTRWEWRDGGWHKMDTSPRYRVLSSVGGTVQPTELVDGPIPAERINGAPLLLIDEWQSYERAPTLVGGE